MMLRVPLDFCQVRLFENHQKKSHFGDFTKKIGVLTRLALKNTLTNSQKVKNREVKKVRK